jgi:3-hydroxyisobutyrate dehydrogenase-like beta-hydroxyacid dehydrogenase
MPLVSSADTAFAELEQREVQPRARRNARQVRRRCALPSLMAPLRDARCSAASRGYTGGFASELMLKDLGLAKDAADSVKLTLPLGSVAHAKYAAMKSSGEGGRDFSAIFESVMKNK